MQRTGMQGMSGTPGMGAQGVVAAGPRAPHGGITPAELELAGRAREQVLDLSVCVNPFGPPGEVFRAVREATLTDYPDPECRLARRRIADQRGVRPEQIALGHGASELLWTLARSLIRPGTRVLLVEPAFGEFGAAAYASGAQIDVLRCTEQRLFDLAWPELGERISRWAPQVVSLAGPSSPAGRHLSLVGLADVALNFPATWFILDQSYLGLSEFSEDLDIALPPNVVALRSLTKELGIPAVRVGYCVAPEPLIRQLDMQRPAWTVSTAAQCAAIAAMRSREQIHEHRQRLLFLRQQLSSGLNELGITTLGSCTHFLLARLPQPGSFRDVGELRYQLLTRFGVLIRDCSGFGLSGWFRVSAHPEQNTLLSALQGLGFRAATNSGGPARGPQGMRSAPGAQPPPRVPALIDDSGFASHGFGTPLQRQASVAPVTSGGYSGPILADTNSEQPTRSPQRFFEPPEVAPAPSAAFAGGDSFALREPWPKHPSSSARTASDGSGQHPVAQEFGVAREEQRSPYEQTEPFREQPFVPQPTLTIEPAAGSPASAAGIPASAASIPAPAAGIPAPAAGIPAPVEPAASVSAPLEPAASISAPVEPAASISAPDTDMPAGYALATQPSHDIPPSQATPSATTDSAGASGTQVEPGSFTADWSESANSDARDTVAGLSDSRSVASETRSFAPQNEPSLARGAGVPTAADNALAAFDGPRLDDSLLEQPLYDGPSSHTGPVAHIAGIPEDPGGLQAAVHFSSPPGGVVDASESLGISTKSGDAEPQQAGGGNVGPDSPADDPERSQGN